MKKTAPMLILSVILFILSATVVPAFSAERERVDVLLYMIDQNINGQITGDKLESRLSTWEYNVGNTVDNLNELLKEVSGLKSQGDETNLPGNSGILAALKERKKNFTVIIEYRRALENFMKGLKGKTYSSRQAFLDEYNDKMDKLSSIIDENEPLIVLERFDIPSRILKLRDELDSSSSDKTLELVKKEWLASRDVFLEYKREVNDLEKLRMQYIKIYKYSIGEGGSPDYLKNGGSGVTPSRPMSKSLSFTPYWGDSPFAWRQLSVGDSINPRIDNVSGGSGLLSYLWTMDGNIIGRQQSASYRFNRPGMHYLVARVQDSSGKSQWKSYAYNVRGGDNNLHFNLDVSDSNPDPGETVFFKITDVYGGNAPYQIRWEMNNSYIGSGYYANYQFPRSGSYNLRVRIRDNYGVEREDTRNFNLGNAGQITFNLWASNSSPRIGETVQFEFRDVRGGSSPYFYNWSSNTGASGSGERFNYTFRKSGLHRLKVLVYDQYKRKTVKYYTYRVGGGSSGSIRASIGYSTDRPSLGQLVTLHASNVSGGSPPYSYEWSVDGTRISGDAGARNTWYREGNSKVTLRVSDSQGSSTSVHHTFRVGSGGGNLTFTDWISNSNPQQHDTVTFKAENVRGGNPPYTYKWEVNGFTIGMFASTTHRFNQTGTYTVKITVKDNSGNVAERTRTVRVGGGSSSLNANFRWNNNNPGPGDTVTFVISNVNGGNSPYSYTHKIDNNVISNGTSATYRFDQARSYRYQAEVRDSSGAVKNTTKIFNIQGSSEPLSFDINVSNSSPRQGDTVNFYARNIKGGVTPYIVTWTMNGRKIGSGQNASYRFDTGAYNLNAVVRDRNGTETSRSHSFNVQGSSNPFRVNFSFSENNPQVGKAVNFKAYNFNGGQPPYNVKWFVDGRQIGTGDNMNYIFNKPGNYNLRAEAYDAFGQKRTTSQTFRVSGSGDPGSGQPDDIFFSITISNSNPRVGDTVHFTVSNLRGGTSPYKIAWSLSNAGNIGNSRSVIWKFKKSGIRAVSCTVTDSRGISRTIRRNIKVQ